MIEFYYNVYSPMSVYRHQNQKYIPLVNKSDRCSGYSSAKRNMKFCMFAGLIIYLVQERKQLSGWKFCRKRSQIWSGWQILCDSMLLSCCKQGKYPTGICQQEYNL